MKNRLSALVVTPIFPLFAKATTEQWNLAYYLKSWKKFYLIHFFFNFPFLASQA
jgi:hypothetical protein